ncbi:MAG: NUDIX domain-containing protein [Candidatus Nanosalina sp.]
MRTEKGVALVAYKQKRGKRRFLVLQRTKNWEGWELPKGHLEDEDYTKTAKQELREEAGIPEEQIENLEELGEELEWSYKDEEQDEEVNREYRGFLVKVSEEALVNVSENPHDEHENGFFMKKEDVESLLTYDNQRELLEAAVTQLKSQG